MNPVELQKNLQKKVIEYLDTALPLKNAKPSWEEAFRAFQNDQENGMNFIRPPYLELTPEYQRADCSLGDLARKGDLAPEVAAAFARYLLEDENANPDRVYPYQHQLNSLTAVQNGGNLVVCTGTGSGKTECFLLPMINAIYRKKQENPDVHHVRALILYPMNALVNDQIRRLRKLLKYLPEITFGRYTSETRENVSKLAGAPDKMVDSLKSAERAGNPATPDENALPNEYLTRKRWAEEGGADILVTNYSMLERLMLLPGTNFFDPRSPWDFIVVDEAHSYAGSLGTEIAWLMRRLERRMRPPKEDHAPIQYIATSATISSGDQNEQVSAAKKFAAGLFPAEPESFTIELGTQARPVEAGAHPLQGLIPDFFTRNKDLYDRTIQFENTKLQWKSQKNAIEQLQQAVDAKGKIKAATLAALSLWFDQPNGHVKNATNREIVITPNLRNLAKFVLRCRGVSAADWREFLHDDSISLGSPVDDKSMGNRLDILDIWGQLRDGELSDGEEVHYLVFRYLYLAALNIIQEYPRYDFPLLDFALELTSGASEHFQDICNKYAAEKQVLDAEESEINKAWEEVLPKEIEADSYRERLYRALVTHEQFRQFRDIFSAISPTFPEIAEKMGIKPEELNQIIQLGGVAGTASRRLPLIDVRYHQVMRDVYQVGVYFENGDITKPHFVRNEEEFAATGEKIFMLGVCRHCGQPYLLAYLNERLTSNHGMDDGKILCRTETGNYQYLHAFSLSGPEENTNIIREDNFPAREEKAFFLDLQAGIVTRSSGNGKASVYWMCSPNAQNTAFIGQCKNCGTEAKVSKVKYGIITPYEATGVQYKIAVLDAFAENSDPAVDPQVRENAPAEGRKVLAFSDSRSQAADLAYRFENTKERSLIQKLVYELARDCPLVLPPAIEKKLDILKQAVALAPMLQQQIAELEKHPPIADPTFPNILGQYPGRLSTRLNKLHYRQLLDLEDNDGNLISDQNLQVSKFMILKALRDKKRRGLLRKELIRLTSRKIEQEANWNWARDEENFNFPEDGQIKEICQKIYSYLVTHRTVAFEGNLGGLLQDELDTYPPKSITRAGFCTADRVHAVYLLVKPELDRMLPDHRLERQQISQWLNCIFDKFANPVETNHGWGILQQNGNEYRLSFDNLAQDLQIWVRDDANQADVERLEEEIMPFVIEEHTAQISSTTGAVYQQHFSQGKINILSCSTTFEMGIDVGGLNNVFLGNLPPTSASYRQRAGRAGRRPGASAYILSLAGRAAHDINFYDDVPSLFSGPITPPTIYLEKPVFAARHFRAEALHSFLAWLNDPNWEKIAYFLAGYHVEYQNHAPIIAQNKTSCCDRLEDWKNERGNDLQDYLKGIRDSEQFFHALNGHGYTAADDLIFQLLLRELPQTDINGDFIYYQQMGGTHLPVIEEENGRVRLSDPRQFVKRLPLKTRLINQLWYADKQGEVDEAALTGASAKGMRYKLLTRQTISLLSECCILPKYGFPVDEIELLPQENDGRQTVDNEAGGVKLRRPLQQGLFEYAPGQVITANKRRFESREACFYMGYQFVPGYVAQLEQNTRYCSNCRKIFARTTENHCPVCNADLVEKRYCTPDAFRAKMSTRRFKPSVSRGTRLVRWGGQDINCRIVGNGVNLKTADSSDRMMQYINPGPRGNGFEGGKFYVHEIQTNIALWDLPQLNFSGSYRDGNTTWNRHYNALLSALYALRRSIASELHVTIDDIGALYDRNWLHNTDRFIFFDTASGGGGYTMALTMKDENDEETRARIRRIVENAIANQENESCGQSEVDADRMPLPLTIFRNLQLTQPEEAANYRPAVSCYHCLKDFDNQFEHPQLDRYDALRVLKSLLQQEEQVPTAIPENGAWPRQVNGRRYIPFSQDDPVYVFTWYLLNNNQPFYYTSITDIDRNTIIGVEM